MALGIRTSELYWVAVCCHSSSGFLFSRRGMRATHLCPPGALRICPQRHALTPSGPACPVPPPLPIPTPARDFLLPSSLMIPAPSSAPHSLGLHYTPCFTYLKTPLLNQTVSSNRTKTQPKAVLTAGATLGTDCECSVGATDFTCKTKVLPRPKGRETGRGLSVRGRGGPTAVTRGQSPF